MRLHLPEAHDLAHDLGVVAVGLGLGVDVADVVAEALLLFLEPLDALDEQAQLVSPDRSLSHSDSPLHCRRAAPSAQSVRVQALAIGWAASMPQSPQQTGPRSTPPANRGRRPCLRPS